MGNGKWETPGRRPSMSRVSDGFHAFPVALNLDYVPFEKFNGNGK